MKVEFRGYTNKNGDFDGGYGEVLQYLATLNDKDATAQVDYDTTYECVDIIAPSLKIKNLNFEQQDDRGNFIATYGKISNKETENIETNKLNISEEKLNNIIKESIIRHLNKL